MFQVEGRPVLSGHVVNPRSRVECRTEAYGPGWRWGTMASTSTPHVTALVAFCPQEVTRCFQITANSQQQQGLGRPFHVPGLP